LSVSGFAVINCPTIATAKIEDLSDFSAKLTNNKVYDGFFLTSATATKVLIEKLLELKIKPSCKTYVLGKRSFDLLKNADLEAVYFPTVNTASEMLQKIAPEDLKGKKFLFIRGEKSLRVVPDFLQGIAEIDEVIVYRTENIAITVDFKTKLIELSENRQIDCAVFFSPSGAEGFLEQCGTRILHQTNIAAIGRTTADFLESRHLKVDFVSPNANEFALKLIEYLGRDKTAKHAENAEKEK
jgi:uroporphyrinogen-III synthase